MFIQIFDSSGVQLTELSARESLKYFSGLTFRTLAGRGYADGSFQVGRDLATWLQIKLANRVKIWDQGKLVYEGQIRELNKALQGVEETITIPIIGYYSVLESRLIRWRWVDGAVTSRMYETDAQLATEDQNRLDSDVGPNFVRVRGGFQDILRAGTEEFTVNYPDSIITGNDIERMTYEIFMRSGEGVTIELWNVDAANIERADQTSTGANVNTNVDESFANLTESVLFNFQLDNADLYDENDRMQIHNPVAYFDLPSFSSPNYYADEIIQDILERKTSDLSSDYGNLQSPALAITPFTVETPTKCSRVIEQLAGFGDSSQNTWGFFVWDSFGSSDDKPLAYLQQRPATTDWEYEVSIKDLTNFTDDESTDAIYNYIYVEWTDGRNQARSINPDDDSTLKDTTSIAAYGQRDWLEKLGKSSQTTAVELAKRRLAYRKDPKRKISFDVEGTIRQKGGLLMPVSRIRAWERVKLVDYNDGEVIVIGSTYFRDEAGGVVTITGEEPPDKLDVLLAQQNLGLPNGE